jgi:CRISPR-associated protein Cmr6
MDYLVPQDTATLLNKHFTKCQNLKLILARYVPDEVIQNSDVEGEKNKKWKDKWLKEMLLRFRVAQGQPTPWTELVTAEHARWKATTARATQFDGRLQSRLLVGLGGKGVMEFGLTLSHVTGLPIIPGSALKGLARAYGLMTIAAELKVPVTDPKFLGALEIVLANHERDKEKREKDKEFEDALRDISDGYGNHPDTVLRTLNDHRLGNEWRTIFGNQKVAGACVFHDAVIKPPLNKALFELDVMTPHFKDYYDDLNKENPDYARADPPHDGQNPNPIMFITVAAKTQFSFAVGLRAAARQELEVQKQAVEWLKKALNELGVGAKTGSGYGVFQISDPAKK